ncbi:hypothetical protein NP234_24140 [Salmonella enterica]|nr:hypothetical protein [Salmonella enterica]
MRRDLGEGDVEKAAALLGREYSFRGQVVHGDAIGRAIGYPTANVTPDDPRKLIPADGVYSGTVGLPGREPATAVVNVGTRPTVGGADRRIEAHMIGFEGDVYGQQAVVTFHSRLRGERKFADVAELARQITDDVRNATLSFKKNV